MISLIMYCVECGNMGNKKLYRCVGCYEDGEPDILMCSSCKKEHDDANDGIEQEYEEFHECKECGNILFENGLPFIPYDPDD